MNPAQQKAHTRKTDELEQAIVDLGTVVYANVNEVGRHADTIVAEERTARLKHVNGLADEQRRYVDTEDARLRADLTRVVVALSYFKKQSLWERLRWLLKGDTDGA